MTQTELETLLDFHYWARDRMLAALQPVTREQFVRPLGNSFASIRDTVAHIYGADLIWLSRWLGEAPSSLANPNDFPDLESVRAAWAQVEERTRSFVAHLGEDGIQKPIQYRTMDGKPHSQVFWHIAQHVVNHGTYHRGQVTTLMRQLGMAPPPSTDLIAFYRSRQV